VKASQLRTCDHCHGPVGLSFIVVRYSLAVVDPQAAQQALREQAFLGPLASAMGTDPDVATVSGDKYPAMQTELLICMDCYVMKAINLAQLAEARDAAASKSEVA
jgi:hypothetical protein